MDHFRPEEYAYAPGIDRPIATIRGATSVEAVAYHVQDELGNVIGLIEDGAAVSQTNSYDAWGTRSETGYAYNNRLRWKSLAWEGDVISLYYMRNRWYDYETGRFMSEDPIGLSGGINLYAFASNDPVNGWDPYGLLDCITLFMPEVAVTTMVGDYTYTFVYEAYTKTVCTGGGGRGGGQPRGGGDGGGWEGGGGGGGPTGEEAAEAIRQIARRTKPLKTAVECIGSLPLAASSVYGGVQVVRHGGRAVWSGALALSAAQHSARYAGRSVVPGSTYRNMAAAADATATTSSAAAASAARAASVAAAGQIEEGLASELIFGGNGSLQSILLGDIARAASLCR